MEMKDVIREKRRAMGFTQEQMADYLGVSAPAVNKWESGTTCPDLAQIQIPCFVSMKICLKKR